MELGSLNSLASVGVTTNLAFGLIEQFRGWLTKQFIDKIEVTSRDIVPALAEYEKNAPVAVRHQIEKISSAFEKTASSGQPIFVASSLGAAVLLIAFLGITAPFGGCHCSAWWTVLMLVLVGAPVGAWWLRLALCYRDANGKLVKLAQRYKVALDAFRELKDKPVEPTMPGPPV